MKAKILKLQLTGLDLSFLVALILISGSCSKDKENDPVNVILDKKILLPILDDHYGFGSGFDTTIYSSSVIRFNKSDYSSIDSMFFVISDLKTTSPVDGSDVSASVSVELFDLTNSVSISNSKIITDDIKSSQYKSSVNILNSLPGGEINLGIRIINNDRKTCSWELHAASIILIRK
jgi:hypothetical protein